jgi:effector-binding domain-containing protein
MKTELKKFSEIPFVSRDLETSLSNLPKLTQQTQQEIKALFGAKLLVPFVRYISVGDMEKVTVSIGFTTHTLLSHHGLRHGNLPAGTYLTTLHTGAYDSLIDTNRTLQEWAKDNAINFQTEPGEDAETWTSRLELYLVGPEDNPNPENWQTELRYLTR